MNTKSRISSILNTPNLDASITGLQPFSLSQLNIDADLDFQLPTNLRLGHLAERIVSGLIKASTNYKVLYENIQLIEDKDTIGELDFIIEDAMTMQVIHMELAYKFYLYDPRISSEPINNWIGPNRNDSLKEKLEKIKTKQFSLLFHNCAKSKFDDIDLNQVSQVLCLLVSLFIPYEYKGGLSPVYEKATKGYYLDLETFIRLDNSDKSYYIPPKKEWGMDPDESKFWTGLEGIKGSVEKCIKEKQAPLCWQKDKETYMAFFIVWWKF